MEPTVIGGIYEYSKKKQLYKLVCIARHSETDEELAVYEALYDDHKIWTRPKDMFFETVEINGKRVPCFRYISNP